MRHLLLVLALLVAGPAAAQVRQSGNVTPGHIATWTTTGVIQDAGSSATPGISSLGIVGQGTPFCIVDAAVNGPYHQLCLGANSSGAGLLSFSAIGGAAALPLTFQINGVSYAFPGVGGPFLPLTGGTLQGPVDTASTIGGVYYLQGVDTTGAVSASAKVKAAIAACALTGARLVFPAGDILIDGSAGTIPLSNCSIEGSGVPGGGTTTAGNGTRLLITNATTPVFTVGSNVSISGFTFYWPGQIGGLIVFPALVQDNGSTGISFLRFERNTVVNAHTIFKGTNTAGWGDIWVRGNQLYAVHAAFEMSGVGDFMTVSDNIFTPGAWFNITGFSAGSVASVNAGISAGNAMFHALNRGAGPAFIVNGSGNSAFGWRYGFLLDATALVSFTDFGVSWDAVGTLVDASSGGTWSSANNLSGSFSSCGITGWGGSPPTPIGTTCFNMGANSELKLTGAKFVSPLSGNLVSTAGGSVYIDNVSAVIGNIADANDYYVVKVTAGSPQVIIRNSALAGKSGSTKTHGVKSSGILIGLQVQNNNFQYFNDIIDIPSVSLVGLVTGNSSISTQGTVSVLLGTASSYQYHSNFWDKPPTATASACGTGATASGAVEGFITVGSTNPTTACTITMPFNATGGDAGNCLFQMQGGQAITAIGPSGGTPWSWSLTWTGSAHTQKISYRCAGVQ